MAQSLFTRCAQSPMMARTTAKKASKRPGPKAKRAAPPRTAKGAKRSPPRQKPGARAKQAGRGKTATRAKARRLSPQRKKEILQRVARPRKSATHTDALPVEEHAHQDPRLLEIKSGNPGDTRGPNMNYGEYKNKAVARMDPPGNWFRKAPKAPEK